MTAKKAKPITMDSENKAKRKIQAEMREAWSEQKEKKERKEDRRTRKDKRKQIEWEKAQAEGVKAMGPVAASRLAKKNAEKNEHREVDVEYEALKREIKSERTAKKARIGERENGLVMFDDME